jgi:Tfp pilus assembly protein FimT
MRAVLIGSNTPSVTWTIRHHATDRSNAGNQVVTGGTTTTSTTSGSDVVAFDDETIPADSFIWLETTAQSGTVDELSVTIVYTVD